MLNDGELAGAPTPASTPAPPPSPPQKALKVLGATEEEVLFEPPRRHAIEEEPIEPTPSAPAPTGAATDLAPAPPAPAAAPSPAPVAEAEAAPHVEADPADSIALLSFLQRAVKHEPNVGSLQYVQHPPLQIPQPPPRSADTRPLKHHRKKDPIPQFNPL